MDSHRFWQITGFRAVLIAALLMSVGSGCSDEGTVDAPDVSGLEDDTGGGGWEVSDKTDAGGADSAIKVDGGAPDAGSADVGDEDAGGPVDGGSVDGAVIKDGCSAETCNGLDDDCDGETDEGSCVDGDPCTSDDCNSGAKQCNHDPIADGGLCDDGSACTEGDTCKGGKCNAGPAKSCGDDNPCTDDACDPNLGGCKNTNVANGKVCDDASKCTADTVCTDGACTGKAVDCDDANACTSEACDPAVGCTSTDADGLACDDGDLCTDKDACAGGACKGAAPDCPGGGPCVSALCDAKTGKCKTETKADVAPCEDGNKCTTGEFCLAGKCQSGETKECSFTSDCLLGICDSESGKCVATTKEDGTKCTDGDACTDGDSCAKGLCMGKGVTCLDEKGCTDDSCDKTKGCLYTPNAAPCDDGNACTLNDACAEGACQAGTAKPCDDQKDCTVDSCDPKTGDCLYDAKVYEGKNCPGDGDACTVSDKCVAGECVIGKPKDCSDGDGCTADVCDPKTAKCSNEQMKPGAACNDGSLCTYKDVCDDKAKCVGTEVPCFDDKACTVDACVAATGQCTYTPIKPGESCDDGDLCTIGDKCDDAGDCVVGLPKVCTDSNACTEDGCDAKTGKCAFPSFVGPCDDKDSCTQGERCTGGQCVTGVDGDVDTVAGNNTGGFLDAKGSKAQLQYPRDVAVDGKGRLVVADYNNHRIRRIDTEGDVSTLAGSGTAAFLNGDAKTARFYYPSGVAVERSSGTVYVSDRSNHRVRIVGDDGKTGTFAGSGTAGWKDGAASLAQFNSPEKVAIGPGGYLYVADAGNHRVRKIAPNGTVSTLAGGAQAGAADGKGQSAQFNGPLGIDVDKQGNVFVADAGNHRLRIILPDGAVTTLAGSTAGYQNGQGTQARFNGLADVTLSPGGYLVVADRYNYRLRRVTLSGAVSSLSGDGIAGWKDGPAATAHFQQPWGVAAGLYGNIYVADTNNHRVRRSSVAKTICDDESACTIDSCHPAKGCQFAALNLGAKCEDGSKCTQDDVCTADGKCTGKAKVCDDGNQCTDDICNPASGVCGSLNNSQPCSDGDKCSGDKSCIGGSCKVAPIVSTFTGSGTPSTVDGVGTQATHYLPRGMDADAVGNLYLVSYQHHRVRRISGTGMVTTVAGVAGKAGWTDGPGALATFNYPADVAVSPANDLYVADRNNHRIRKISNGVVTTFAGSGNPSFLDGTGVQARFYYPEGIAVDQAGNIYVADTYNHRVRKINQAGVVTTVAGSSQGYVEGKGTAARFYRPGGIAVDAAGNIFVADTYNHRIRGVKPDGQTSLLAGSGAAAWLDAVGATARFYYPRDLAVDGDGKVYVADSSNNRVRVIGANAVVDTLMGGAKPGYKDGPVSESLLNYPAGVAITSAGLYVSDYNNHRTRLLKPNKKICNDFNPCTKDSCDPASAECKFEPIANCCAKEKLWLHFNDDSQAKGLIFANCASAVENYAPTNCKVLDKQPDKGWQVWTKAVTAISSPGALYYGDPAAKNYNWGTNAGTVRTPKVKLPAGPASVEFWIQFNVEAGTKYDQVKVFLIADGARVVVGAAGQPNMGALFQKGDQPWDVMNSWYKINADISKWAGKEVQLEFYFNTGEAITNSTLGALVDDVKILGTCPK